MKEKVKECIIVIHNKLDEILSQERFTGNLEVKINIKENGIGNINIGVNQSVKV